MPHYSKRAQFTELAEFVARIPRKPPALSVTRRGAGRTGTQHALKLLARSSDGCTEAMLLAQGFKPLTLAALIQLGLAAVHVEGVRAGGEALDVRRLRITKVGRRALAGRA